jgi:hypothetical protein
MRNKSQAKRVSSQSQATEQKKPFWPDVSQVQPADRRRSGSGSDGSGRLLRMAAQHIRLNSNKRTGEHMGVMEALRAVANAQGEAKSTVARATAIVNLLFTDPATGRLVEFGKTYSESGNEHARAAVIRNMETRIAALMACATRAGYVLSVDDRKKAGKTNTAPATGQHLQRAGTV